MARRKEIDDEDASDALCYGGKSGPVPAHPAMAADEQDPNEPEPDDDDDDERERK